MINFSPRGALLVLALLGVSALEPASAQYYDPRSPYGAPPPPPRYDERPRYEQPRGGAYQEPRNNQAGQPSYEQARNAQVRQQQQQYNQNITALQQQHNQGVVALQQQFNQGRLSRAQLDAGIAQLGRQYAEQVAQQQRALPR
jgi:hypothetical protein